MVSVRRAALVMTIGAVVAGLGSVVPAAASPAPPPATTRHVIVNFTGGWQEEFGPAGNLISDVSFTFVGLIAGLGPGTIVFEGKVGTTQYINKFTGPYNVHLEAGNTYSTAQGSSIDTPCAGSFEVDDFVLNGKSATSAAVQYAMTCPGGYRYLGAMAANLLNVPGTGYYVFTKTGALYGLGNNAFLCYLGDLSARPLNAPVVAMAITPDNSGYYMVGADGGVFAFGDAGYFGSTGSLHLVAPIVGIATTLDGDGYWLVAADGGVFAFGDARYQGSMGGKHLNQPMVGMEPSRYGGYWLVAADGGVFAFGNAVFEGSSGAHPPTKPVVALTTAPDGTGYWLVAADGQVFTYGDALSYGPTGDFGATLAAPIVSIAATPDGGGYWLLGQDGGVFSFGDARYAGGLAGLGVPEDFAGIVTTT